MIIGKDVTPNKKLYYLGGKILDIFKDSTEMQFFDVFQRISEKEKISINLFTLTLDWLFLLQAVELDKENIKKCF